MSRLAIKQYLISQINVPATQTAILANTVSWTTVIALRQVPKFEKLGTGFFIITGPSRRMETRLSGARGGGQKKGIYRMRIWAHAVAKDEQIGGDDFDTAWENLLQVLRTMNVQVGITDPNTAVQSWLHEIGENIEDSVEEPKQSANQGLVRFFAEAFVNIEEVTNTN